MRCTYSVNIVFKKQRLSHMAVHKELASLLGQLKLCSEARLETGPDTGKMMTVYVRMSETEWSEVDMKQRVRAYRHFRIGKDDSVFNLLKDNMAPFPEWVQVSCSNGELLWHVNLYYLVGDAANAQDKIDRWGRSLFAKANPGHVLIELWCRGSSGPPPTSAVGKGSSGTPPTSAVGPRYRFSYDIQDSEQAKECLTNRYVRFNYVKKMRSEHYVLLSQESGEGPWFIFVWKLMTKIDRDDFTHEMEDVLQVSRNTFTVDIQEGVKFPVIFYVLSDLKREAEAKYTARPNNTPLAQALHCLHTTGGIKETGGIEETDPYDFF